MHQDPNATRGEAKPVARIVTRGSNLTIGWRYLWENGELTNLWLIDQPQEFEYIGITPNRLGHVEEF